MNTTFRITLLLLFVILGACMLALSGCAVNKTKNIAYQPATSGSPAQHLNIFSPKKNNKPADVLIFVHGGNWNSGKKSQYNFIARNWARKGVVTVLIDYPLSPLADYKTMAEATVQSVKWVKENAVRYNGNPDRIFISGHSAGGHLAALVSTDEQYFEKAGLKSPLAGTILIDAAGLDMYGYLNEEKFTPGHTYLNTFTNTPETWKEATPIYNLRKNLPPMLLYRGGKSYPSIIESNEKFIKALHSYAPETPYRIQAKKKHIGMITQFFNPWNGRYGEILEWMSKTKQAKTAATGEVTERKMMDLE